MSTAKFVKNVEVSTQVRSAKGTLFITMKNAAKGVVTITRQFTVVSMNQGTGLQQGKPKIKAQLVLGNNPPRIQTFFKQRCQKTNRESQSAQYI